MERKSDNIISFPVSPSSNGMWDLGEQDKNTGNGGGGGMDNLDKRVERLETDVKEIRVDVREIRADVVTLKVDVSAIKATLATEFTAIHREMATKADVNAEISTIRVGIAELKTDIHAMGMKIVMWNIGSMLAVLGLMIAALKLLPGGH